MSKRRRAKAARSAAQTPVSSQPRTQAEQGQGNSNRKSRKNVAKHSTILFWITAVALLFIFLGRWIYAIDKGYFGTFIQIDASIDSAVANMRGLNTTAEEQDALLNDQQAWDQFTSSRLCDQVEITAQDGVTLHGYLYNEESDVTAVMVPRFSQDGTADFLLGAWLNEQTGCNILLIAPRAHGDSGGDYFGYGYLEQHDLTNWLDWAEDTMGQQSFLLYGEGTGANTILFAEANGLLPESVTCAVAESPYASLHQLASRNIWKWYTVPAFPFLNVIEWELSRSDAGYTAADVNLGEALSAGEQSLPVLFLQTSGDEYILPEWSQTVYDAYSGEKELVTSSGTHGTVYSACRGEVQSILTAWLDAE